VFSWPALLSRIVTATLNEIARRPCAGYGRAVMPHRLNPNELYMRSRLLKAVLAPLVVFVCGCSAGNVARQDPVQNSVYKHTAYPQSPQEVHDAYLKAIQEMDLVVTSSTDARIHARSNETEATVIVEIGPSDTLVTDVLISSDYVMRGRDFTHYPYELSYKASQHLDKSKGFAYTYPQAVYPSHLTECRAPNIQHTEGVEMPELIGGLQGLASRLSYTPEALRAGIEGRIYVEAVVDEKGEVACAEIDTGLPGGLNERALAAMVASRFKPASFQGRPLAVKISLPITFRR